MSYKFKSSLCYQFNKNLILFKLILNVLVNIPSIFLLIETNTEFIYGQCRPNYKIVYYTHVHLTNEDVLKKSIVRVSIEIYIIIKIKNIISFMLAYIYFKNKLHCLFVIDWTTCSFSYFSFKQSIITRVTVELCEWVRESWALLD